MSDLVWVSNRNMMLGEYSARKGVPIPDDVITQIPELRFNALVRVTHIRQVEKATLGEMCPLCGEGPFTRLARHTTAKHEVDPQEVVDMVVESMHMALGATTTSSGGEEE